MTEPTEDLNLDPILEDSEGDSDVLAKVRAKARKEAQARKEAEAKLAELLTAQTNQRLEQLEAAVNGSTIPRVAIEAIKSQVESMDAIEFATALQELSGVATESAEPSTEQAQPAVNVSDLASQVAAAAAGGNEVDPTAKLNEAKNRQELWAAANELGLDRI